MTSTTLASLLRAASFMDAVSVQFGRAAAILTYLLLFFIILHVVLRYVFSLNLIQLEEIHWHLYAAAFLLGLGYTYVKDAHVRVDLVYEGLSPVRQAWINLLGALFLLLPFCIILGYFSFEYFWASWRVGEASEQPGALPARYVLKFFMFLGLFVLGWQAVSVMIRSIYVIGGGSIDAGTKEIEEQVRL